MSQPASELFGNILALQFAITEVLGEMAVDTIQEHPRTVLMALRGLEAQAKELVRLAKQQIETPAA